MVFQVRGTPIGALTIFIAMLASMGGFLFGWDTGQISGLTAMDDFRARFATIPNPASAGGKDWNPWLEGVVVSLLSVGTAIGVLIGAPLADKFGRRWAMVYECIIFDIGVIIQVTAFYSWEQVAIGRLITGLGVGALSAAVPLYQSETVPRQVRGALVGTYQLFITLGMSNKMVGSLVQPNALEKIGYFLQPHAAMKTPTHLQIFPPHGILLTPYLLSLLLPCLLLTITYSTSFKPNELNNIASRNPLGLLYKHRNPELWKFGRMEGSYRSRNLLLLDFGHRHPFLPRITSMAGRTRPERRGVQVLRCSSWCQVRRWQPMG